MNSVYDVIIVGGGINGAGVYRDLSLHGVSTLLLEKGDFASQTSQSSSKMLHGGIRYLENYDFGLVKEALHEKNLWLKIAPHLACEKAFYLPNYKESKYPLWMVRVGLQMYDFLSSFENSPYRILNQAKTLAEIPELKKTGLNGSGVYYDAIVSDAQLTLESIYDGSLEKNSKALNYFEVVACEQSATGWKVKAVDRLNQRAEHFFECKELVFTAGPFTDKLLNNLATIPWKNQLLPTKGIHIWVDKEYFPLKHPVVLQTTDNRIIFVIPDQESVLVGTTESVTEEEFFNIQATNAEIEYLLSNLNEFFPESKIETKHILSHYAGIRPLVKDESRGPHATSRKHKVFKVFDNVHIILGGKLTTFRAMCRDISEPIIKKQKLKYNPHLSMNPFRQKSVFPLFEKVIPTAETILQSAKTEQIRTLKDLINRRMYIPNINHWEKREATKDTNFKQFFTALLPELAKEIKVDATDIENFLNDR